MEAFGRYDRQVSISTNTSGNERKVQVGKPYETVEYGGSPEHGIKGVMIDSRVGLLKKSKNGSYEVLKLVVGTGDDINSDTRGVYITRNTEDGSLDFFKLNDAPEDSQWSMQVLPLDPTEHDEAIAELHKAAEAYSQPHPEI